MSGVELNEYPGRTFHFSSVSGSMAELTAEALGSNNRMTKAQAAKDADQRTAGRALYLGKVLSKGTHIKAVVPRGSAGSEEDIQAVISADGDNINRELINRGYGVFRTDLGGAEQQAMHGSSGRHWESTPRQCSSKEIRTRSIPCAMYLLSSTPR